MKTEAGDHHPSLLLLVAKAGRASSHYSGRGSVGIFLPFSLLSQRRSRRQSPSVEGLRIALLIHLTTICSQSWHLFSIFTLNPPNKSCERDGTRLTFGFTCEHMSQVCFSFIYTPILTARVPVATPLGHS